MKRYKSKKDLPKYPAGTEFRVTRKGHLATGNTVVYHKNDLEKYPNILRDWFEEIPEEPKTVEELKEGDKYYYILDTGYVSSSIWCGFDIARRATGNVFMTIEGAEKELA